MAEGRVCRWASLPYPSPPPPTLPNPYQPLQTLAESKHRGRVRIMVVNTEEARSVYVPGASLGSHWFVVAWCTWILTIREAWKVWDRQETV